MVDKTSKNCFLFESKSNIKDAEKIYVELTPYGELISKDIIFQGGYVIETLNSKFTRFIFPIKFNFNEEKEDNIIRSYIVNIIITFLGDKIPDSFDHLFKSEISNNKYYISNHNIINENKKTIIKMNNKKSKNKIMSDIYPIKNFNCICSISSELQLDENTNIPNIEFYFKIINYPLNDTNMDKCVILCEFYKENKICAFKMSIKKHKDTSSDIQKAYYESKSIKSIKLIKDDLFIKEIPEYFINKLKNNKKPREENKEEDEGDKVIKKIHK